MGSEQPENGAQSVLLVDGEVLARHELAEYLRHCEYHVIEASTTDEAVTVLSEARINIDAVLCSAEALGGLNGFELARWIRSTRPGIPVLLAGNYEKVAEAAGELCEEGPELARPYDSVIVVDRIRRRLAARERNRGN
jgi:DNA-binding NtrC family response regulator